jgi:hypothetical protein
MNAINFDVLEHLTLCAIEIIEYSSNILWKKKSFKKFMQGGQCTYNVILMRVRVTIVAVEKQ